MKPETIIYRLKLKGYSLSKLAREMGVSRQAVWYVVHQRFAETDLKMNQVRRKIRELIK